MKINRVILLVLDSVGIGYTEDAYKYGDEGANTLLNIYKASGGLNIGNLFQLGLGKLINIEPAVALEGCYGKMASVSPGKDTTTGHWELAGLEIKKTFPVYKKGFPEEIIEEFEKQIEIKTLGNYPSSGTEIIQELGLKHYESGCPIVYTSADSVFQIATHNDVVSLEKLYEYSRIAREILTGKNSVARVIARPFKGERGAFERDNPNRKDFSVLAPEDTLLDILKRDGQFVCGVGKIGDIFAHRGLTEEIKTKSNMDSVEQTISAIKRYKEKTGLIFTNLVDFDSIYGHRRDIKGYAEALEEFDRKLPDIMDAMSGDEILIITADHGCDPTYTAHTDHTKEYVPLMVYGEKISCRHIEDKKFADCGQTIADFLGCPKLHYGHSFRSELMVERKG